MLCLFMIQITNGPLLLWYIFDLANTQSNNIANACSINITFEEPNQTAHFSGMFQMMLVAFVKFDLFSISDSCLSYIADA